MGTESDTTTPRPVGPPTETDARMHRRMRILGFLFMALFLVVPLTAGLVVYLYGPEVERDAYANLESIARMKVEQLENWLHERDSDAEVLREDHALAVTVDDWAHGRADVPEQVAVQARLAIQRRQYHLSSVMVLTPELRPLLSIGNETAVDTQTNLLAQGPDAFRVHRSPLYRMEDGRPGMQWLVPLVRREGGVEKIAGFIVLRVNAHDFVYPLVQTWPTASPSGETLLVRRVGDEVEFINELRHRRGSALKLSFGLNTTSLPAAEAVRSPVPGIIEGLDYRKVAVLAAYRPVRGTDWRVVTKIDHDEILGPLYRLA
ncbi:MAG: hypothetical protein E6Q78_08160 [Rhodoferax sp.]|nr:MAG: hypothetical protein E6Q78_08160 [Rhodoferax sp.]